MTSDQKKTVLVTGATGQQGGAVTRALLERGHDVRALVRDPESEKAAALAGLGVQLAQGDMDDVDSIARAAEGVDAMFVVTTPFVGGVELEAAQGRNLVDGAAAAGVPHVVYSSVASADKGTGIPHFDSKWAVEQHLAASGLNWTVTAPVYFNENVSSPWLAGDLEAGRFRQALSADRGLQVIGIDAIGDVNALILEAGESYYGERIDIASDEVTGTEIAAALTTALGRDIEYQEQPIEEVRAAFGEDMALMYEWFDRVAYDVDIEALKTRFPTVEWTGFAEWSTGAFKTVTA